MNTRKAVMITISVLLFGALIGGTALAASYTVTESALQGWIITQLNPTVSSYVAFEDAPDGEPALLMGSGPENPSATRTGGKVYLGRSDYAGTSLDDFSTLKYSTYMTQSGPSNLTIYINLFIDADGNGTGDTILSFSPGDCPTYTTVVANTWQTWDAMTQQAWRVNVDNLGSLSGLGTTCVTLSQIKAAINPSNVLINWAPSGGEYGIDYVIGQKDGGTGWDNVEGYIDNIVINGDSYAFGVKAATEEETVTETTATAEDIARSQATLITDLNGNTHSIVRASAQPGAVVGGGVYYRILVENSDYVYAPAELGNMDVINRGPLQAVDVFGMRGTESVLQFNSGVDVCLLGSGHIMLLDATTSPRALSQAQSWASGGYTCTTITHAASVILVP